MEDRLQRLSSLCGILSGRDYVPITIARETIGDVGVWSVIVPGGTKWSAATIDAALDAAFAETGAQIADERAALAGKIAALDAADAAIKG